MATDEGAYWVRSESTGQNTSLQKGQLCVICNMGDIIWQNTIDLVFYDGRSVISCLNSLWLGDALCWHRSGSTSAQVMACCLTAPSHYLNQCWLIIGEVKWQSPEGNIISYTSAINCLILCVKISSPFWPHLASSAFFSRHTTSTAVFFLSLVPVSAELVSCGGPVLTMRPIWAHLAALRSALTASSVVTSARPVWGKGLLTA